MTRTVTKIHFADASIAEDVAAACQRIAPAWPLDRLIAVNPYWGWVQQPMQDAAAELGPLSGTPMLMSRAWYRQQRAAGRLPDHAIRRALSIGSSTLALADVLRELEGEDQPLPVHPLVSDLRDALRPTAGPRGWHDHILMQMGRICESYFDQHAAVWTAQAAAGLYAFWKSQSALDATPRLLLGAKDIAQTISALPERPEALIADALDTLALPRSARASYLTALLLDVNGWASAAAFRRWDARLAGRDDESIVELLAVRLAWELTLFRSAQGTDLHPRWIHARRHWSTAATQVARDNAALWVLQRAIELHYHERLGAALVWHPSLRMADSGAAAPALITAQAVFCIDVRSEVIRRHLEDVAPGVRTAGFAGFFGIPLAYQAPNGSLRPQLPGLLAASVIAADVAESSQATAPVSSAAATLGSLARALPSTFSYVEATGLQAAFSMMRAAFDPQAGVRDSLREGLDAMGSGYAPQLVSDSAGRRLSSAQEAALAASALRGMGLTASFARLVVFVGHGATVTNNPQRAGLACGACGGQSGEINARVLATLLNREDIRRELAGSGIKIPSSTAFVAALHDTVTDDVLLFPEAELEATHADDIETVRDQFLRASHRTRRERAAALHIAADSELELAEAMRRRASDWSEVRPEWALARNASFIAAPRSRSRALDLNGRAFLHEYDSRRDEGFAILESIMTAPVVVAHWINAQYWASTVDPLRYGSGDKSLHNVVGGNLGVYEGAGGDLRIGLAKQSVHNGTDWVHEPLRLAVFIEAPAAAIDAILAKHAVVASLVFGEWMHLYRIDPADDGLFLRRRDGWERVAHGAATREHLALA